MRFRFFIFGRLVVAVLLCSTPLLFSPAAAEMTAVSSAPTARILHIEGKIAVKEPDSVEWKTPKQGTWVTKGSQIKTGDGSSCDIGLGEDHHSMVHMTGNTRTVLHALDADKIRVNLEEGSIFARVRDLKKGSTFEVASPTAVATARGTGWEQSVDEINVFEHSVEVEGSGGEIMLVEEGFGVDIDGSGDLKEPEALPAEDKAEWENFETQADNIEAQEASLPADPGFSEEAPNHDEEAPNSDAAGTDDPKDDPADDDHKPEMEGPDDPNMDTDMSDLPGSDSPNAGDDDPNNMDMDMPDFPGSDGPNAGDMEGPSTGEMDTMENSFDSFEDGFGSGGYEGGSGDTTSGGPSPEDYLGEAKEEQQETLPPPPFDPDGSGSMAHCFSQGGTDTTC